MLEVYRMSHVTSTTTGASGSTPPTERGLFDHKDLPIWVEFAGSFYQVCLLILMYSRSGNVLQWALLPFQPGKYIKVMRSFLEFLVVPALRNDHPFPSAICIQTDPAYSPLLSQFFTELAASGGPTVSLRMMSILDSAKLDTFFEHVHEYFAEWNEENQSHSPSIEEIKEIIGGIVQRWNEQSNRWDS